MSDQPRGRGIRAFLAFCLFVAALRAFQLLNIDPLGAVIGLVGAFIAIKLLRDGTLGARTPGIKPQALWRPIFRAAFDWRNLDPRHLKSRSREIELQLRTEAAKTRLLTGLVLGLALAVGVIIYGVNSVGESNRRLANEQQRYEWQHDGVSGTFYGVDREWCADHGGAWITTLPDKLTGAVSSRCFVRN